MILEFSQVGSYASSEDVPSTFGGPGSLQDRNHGSVAIIFSNGR